MAQVVRETGTVDDVGIASQHGTELATDLGDLEGVREPVADEVVVPGGQHLGLGGEATQRSRVHQTGSVPCEVVPIGTLVRRVLGHPALAVERAVRVRCQAHESILAAAWRQRPQQRPAPPTPEACHTAGT